MAKSEKTLVKKVTELRPLDTGLAITVKVVDTKVVVPRGRQTRITESLVGDASGMIILVARNDQGTFGLLTSFVISSGCLIYVSCRSAILLTSSGVNFVIVLFCVSC